MLISWHTFIEHLFRWQKITPNAKKFNSEFVSFKWQNNFCIDIVADDGDGEWVDKWARERSYSAPPKKY